MKPLLRAVLAELKANRARAIALAMAVALGTGMLAAAIVLSESMRTAVDRGLGVDLAGVDLVVRTELSADSAETTSGSGVVTAMSPSDIRKLQKVDGVSEVGTMLRSQAVAQVGDVTRGITVETQAEQRDLQWQGWAEGRAPATATEVALTKDTLDALRVGVGDQIALGHPRAGRGVFTVSGAVDLRGSLRYGSSAYALVTPDVAKQLSGVDGPNTALITLDPGAKPDDVVQRINSAAAVGWVQTADELTGAVARTQGGQVQALGYVGVAFAVVTVLASALVLATTMTVSMSSRRRAMALLRCVGASRRQLVASVVLEVLVLGIAGGILGLAAGVLLALASLPLVGLIPSLPDVPVSAFTVDLAALAIPPAVGLLLALVAAFVPAVLVSRVAPAEALRAAPASTPGRVRRWVSAVVSVALVVGGFLLLTTGSGVGTLIVGAVMATVGAVAGTAPLLAVLGRRTRAMLAAKRAPTRLAAGGIAQEPSRSAAETVALMLAAALVTLAWVSLASIGSTISSRLDASPGADLEIGAPTGSPPIAERTVDKLTELDGVAEAVPLPYGRDVSIVGRGERGNATVATGTVGADAHTLAKALPAAPPVERVQPDTVYLPRSEYPPYAEGARVQLKGPDGKTTLRVRYVEELGVPSLVAPDALAKVSKATDARTLWLKLAPGADRAAAVDEITGIAVQDGPLPVGGPALADLQVARVVATAQAAATALLAMTVLVTIVGAATTAALSVSERAREHAVLRALGMERRALRRMLTVRVLGVSAIGVLLGIALGSVIGLAVATRAADALGVDARWAIPVVPVVIVVIVLVTVVRAATLVPLEKASYVRPARALAET